MVMVNNSMVTNNLQHDQLGGATSSGEFGSILRAIFAPESGDRIRVGALDRPARPLAAGLRVPHRPADLHHPSRGFEADDHGPRRVARSSSTATPEMVMRIHFECEGIPADFPIRAVTLDQDYDFADIGGQQFMLPLRSDVRSREAGYESWNEVSFSGYRKFAADATITFEK